MDWINENQALLEVVLTSMFVIFNVVVVIYSVKAQRIAEESLASMKRQHAEIMAPEVSLDLELDWERGFSYLVLQNSGRTAATNVHVRLHQVLKLSLEIDFARIPCFSHPLSLAPGQKERYFLGLIGPILGERLSRRERGRTTSEMPFPEATEHNKTIPALTGEIRYEDRTRTSCTVPVEINLEALRKSRHIVREGFGSLVEEMGQLVHTAERVSHMSVRR